MCQIRRVKRDGISNNKGIRIEIGWYKSLELKARTGNLEGVLRIMLRNRGIKGIKGEGLRRNRRMRRNEKYKGRKEEIKR